MAWAARKPIHAKQLINSYLSVKILVSINLKQLPLNMAAQRHVESGYLRQMKVYKKRSKDWILLSLDTASSLLHLSNVMFICLNFAVWLCVGQEFHVKDISNLDGNIPGKIKVSLIGMNLQVYYLHSWTLSTCVVLCLIIDGNYYFQLKESNN